MSLLANPFASSSCSSSSSVSFVSRKSQRPQPSFVACLEKPVQQKRQQLQCRKQIHISRISRRSTTVCEVSLKVESAQADQEVAVGSKIKVKGPLKVFHVPKHPEFELGGHEGEVKAVLTSWKGKTISANLPYKVQFLIDVDGKPVKFFAHLRDNEFEVIG